MKPSLVLVVDTLVVVSAIIGNTSSASFALLRAIETGDCQLAVSDDWLRELVRVLEYPRIANLIGADQSKPARAFRIALGIGLMGRLQ
jgi:predicted nucleic acid-binding protein